MALKTNVKKLTKHNIWLQMTRCTDRQKTIMNKLLGNKLDLGTFQQN